MRRAVVDLASSRPVWRIPDECVDEIRRAFGEGWEVVVVRSFAESDGDGAHPSAEAVAASRGAEVYLGWGIPRPVAEAASGTLRWAHSAAAGVGASLTEPLLESGAMLTNSRGVHAEPMADWAVAAIGYCVRGFHVAQDAQRGARWAKDLYTDGGVVLKEYADTRIGIVGLGGIGQAIARRCVALGMRVRAIRRRPERRKPAGVEWVAGPASLTELAAESDVLVIAAPHTRSTDGLVNDRVISSLPAGAFIINLSRGVLLDEVALLVHLDSGHLGGAVLDVFHREPLPADHPLWCHPRVLITPHVSAVSERFWEREIELIVENIDRYLSNRRLKNLVDSKAEY